MARNSILVDRGWARLNREIRVLRRASVKVGVRSGAEQNGVAVIDYALWNEYGTSPDHGPAIPARPFMRTTAERHHEQLQRTVSGAVRRILAGTMTADQVLDYLGLWYQARIRATIRDASSWAVPNAPSTIASKGSSKPLIDHGVLINSIDYQKGRR